MNTGFDQDKSKLSITVVSVAFQVLSHSNGLLDQLVQVFWDLGGKSVALEDTEDLVSGNVFDLSNSMVVSQDDTNLRRSQTLLGELADLLNNFLGRGL